MSELNNRRSVLLTQVRLLELEKTVEELQGIIEKQQAAINELISQQTAGKGG